MTGERNQRSWLPPLLLALGLASRLLAVGALPVVFDETCVMGYGLARALQRPASLLFEIPIAVSNGITPLWFWLQAMPAAVFGESSKAGLRTLPVLLGLATVWLCHRTADRLGGARAGLIAGALAAIHSPFLFANARGEYSESLLMPLVLLLFRDLEVAGENPPPRATLWPALALLAYLGKGLLVWLAYACFLALLWLAHRRTPGAAPRPGLLRLSALIAVPLLPSLAWLLAAQGALFAGGATLGTDLGLVHSVWQNLARLTLGYGTSAQARMVGGWREALYVYTDFEAWPTLCLLAPPGLLALVALGLDLAASLRRRQAAGTARSLLPLCLMLIPTAAIVAKGAVDVRFHLLAAPLWLVYAALGVERWISALETRWRGLASGGALASWVYVAWTQLGSRPEARLAWLAAGLATALGLALAARSRRLAGAASPALIPVALFALWSSATLGPLDWGRRWAWEPSPLPGDVPRGVGTFPNADLQIAQCALSRVAAPGTRELLLRALERHPLDRETVLRAGGGLLATSRRDAARVAAVARELSRRSPQDETVRRLLERALSVGAASPERAVP